MRCSGKCEMIQGANFHFPPCQRMTGRPAFTDHPSAWSSATPARPPRPPPPLPVAPRSVQAEARPDGTPRGSDVGCRRVHQSTAQRSHTSRSGTARPGNGLAPCGRTCRSFGPPGTCSFRRVPGYVGRGHYAPLTRNSSAKSATSHSSYMDGAGALAPCTACACLSPDSPNAGCLWSCFPCLLHGIRVSLPRLPICVRLLRLNQSLGERLPAGFRLEPRAPLSSFPRVLDTRSGTSNDQWRMLLPHFVYDLLQEI